MPAHSSHLLQPLDIGCFSVLKRAYSRFISDLARVAYNHIDKFDFLADYQQARIKAFQPSIIQSSFATAGLVPINPERVLTKLNISLRTPSPPSSRLSSKSSEFNPETPKTIVQLQKQVSIYKELLKQRSNSPPSPSKTILDRIVKGHTRLLHDTALLLQDNANLRAANEKKRQKRRRSNRRIAHEGGLSVEEGLQLVQQLNQLVEGDGLVSHRQGDVPSQPDQAAKRAPPRCSGCGQVGHKINVCKNR
jgi:DDE superfamily endonuclease